VIVAVVLLHLVALHTHGSNNPLGIDKKGPQDSIPFHPYYTVKDLFGLAVFLLFYCAVVFFAPNMFGEPDNYIPANPLATPPEIVPEWYFLPFYAILRSTPDILFISAKLAGVMAMGASILLLFVLPWLDTSPVRSGKFRPVFRIFFWLLVIDCLVLGYIGGQPVNNMTLTIGRTAEVWYFLHFLVILPVLGKFERPLPLPTSIAQAVLKGGAPPATSRAPMEKP
jgi:quinol-cytochrome oxidoreductase complex cytochrome b subunit